MPWSTSHIKKWITKLDDTTTLDGMTVSVYRFDYDASDEKMMSVWAKHFRNHYCLDTIIDKLKPKSQTRRDYLQNIKFPSTTSKLGPSIIAGDFAEILLADFFEYFMKLWVPRVRWGRKIVRDESPKGSDIIGFKKDHLFIVEAKAKFSNSKSEQSRLQDAVNDSSKDHLRIDESLNYIKQIMIESNNSKGKNVVERFQSPVDFPYNETYSAAVVIADEFFDIKKDICKTDCTKIKLSKKGPEVMHPKINNLMLIAIHGRDLQNLAKNLYKRAADEA